ncbi:tRNA (adenosine(37)-N6)-threonylcarbamoyltransferase complex dimerization subunit type 1 TsaB [Deinococcus lacus]|uniref:tRNA (Adenosine(37)-N6)-threonylcarbamoyltransferase complex dimerization subunit type 1 TsaB n=1 Tax=Deinococcus lacus TaxID=392561 RepID=A0ABW1Y9P7_9DEIO
MTTPDAPITLALDTATPYLTLGLAWRGGQLETAERIERAHAERLPGSVAALFEQAGLPLRAGRLVIGTGPGSYTGVRVGASYALGLGRAWGVPVLGVSTLEALAGSDDGPVAPALDARKGYVYGAVYQVSGGQVCRTLAAPDKFLAEDFAALAQSFGAGVRPDSCAPSGLTLLRSGLRHGQTEWSLAYL